MIGKILDILRLQIIQIRGSSMEPALSDGSWVVVSRRAFRPPRKPGRFDIVRFEDPSRPGHWSVKRVVGLPGEEVSLEDGQLLVDGRRVTEPYIDPAHTLNRPGNGRHVWFPRAGEYVVLGDNRVASSDSRKFGPVPVSGLRGRVIKRLR